jgi:hypothetical protein
MTCEHRRVHVRATMPAAARDAFVTGAWDTTGLLLERFEECRGVAARLPYIHGFSADAGAAAAASPRH